MTRSLRRAVASLLTLAGVFAAESWAGIAPASADTPEPGTQPPDESVLGTVDVTGAAAAPLPKLAVMPIVTTNEADTTLQLVVKKDLDLSGQFEVVSDDAAPSGLYLHDSAVDVAAWRAKGIAILVRVLANKLPSGKMELLGSAYFVGRGTAPAFEHRIETDAAQVRSSSHRMTDALLGALSGRPGGFASHMVYSGRVGRNRQIFGIDADGFNLHTESPAGDTALAPAFGHKGETYYALSHDYLPFKLVRGPSATPVPIALTGSVFGIAFSPDHAKIAISVAKDGTSHIHVGNADGTALQPISTVPLANHPVFGPGARWPTSVAAPPGNASTSTAKPIHPRASMRRPRIPRHPQRARRRFHGGVGAGADLVSTDSRGGTSRASRRTRAPTRTPRAARRALARVFLDTQDGQGARGSTSCPWLPLAMRVAFERVSRESLRWESLP
jgi:TolB protein